MPPEDRPFLYVTGSLYEMFALSDFFFLFSAIEYSRQQLLCSLDERHESLFYATSQWFAIHTVFQSLYEG
jgi:hypothetical protein